MKRAFYPLVALVLVAVGLGAGLLVAQAPPPAVLASADALGYLDVAGQDWLDERTASLALTLGPQRLVVAPVSGVVTKADCAPGEPLASGASTYAVSGHRLLNLATTVPLWRDLHLGDKGADVEALHRELTRLGQHVTGTTVTARTLAAYNRVAAHAGAARVDKTVARSRVVWLAGARLPAVSCGAAVGSTVQAGDTLAELSRRVSAAVPVARADDLAPGARVFLAGGHRLTLGDSLTVDADGLLFLSDHPDLAVTNADRTTVTGVLELARPVPVIGVPPAALGPIRGADSCVVTPDGPRSVTILGSQLGVTYVTAAGTVARVAVDAGRITGCP
jgi:hypothetical protein